MIKSILVCSDGSPDSDAACALSVRLAKRLGASLTALHVLDARTLEGPLMADIAGWVGAQPFSAQLAQFRDLMEAKSNAILEAFQDICEKGGITAETSSRMGNPARVILEEEAKAELVVLGQQGEHATWMEGFSGSTLDRVVRHSLKPCLVVPTGDHDIQRILAAYDGSGHASRALHEAIELSTALAVPLVILTVAEDGDLERARATSEDAMKLARAHECVAANYVVEGPPDKCILDKAVELDASLLVVGAHGHTRVRQFVLGSVTTSLLRRCRIPIMLAR